MKLLTKEQQESDENAKSCYSCEKKLENKYLKDKKYGKARYHIHYTWEYRGAAHSIYKSKHGLPKKIVQFFIMNLAMIIIIS